MKKTGVDALDGKRIKDIVFLVVMFQKIYGTIQNLLLFTSDLLSGQKRTVLHLTADKDCSQKKKKKERKDT